MCGVCKVWMYVSMGVYVWVCNVWVCVYVWVFNSWVCVCVGFVKWTEL
jgi:hypothetical protein